MNFASEAENNTSPKNHNKAKFCLRILQLLNTTLNNNLLIPKVGLAWCEDGVHFICNSQILGNYLGLKANSINTNFRAHSFQIESLNSEEIKKLFGNLPDIKNWKMRRNVSFIFSSDSREVEVEKIPCLEKNKRALDTISSDANSILPPIVFDLLKNDKYHLHQVEMLMKKVDFTPNWKNKFLGKASKDWFVVCQRCNTDQNMINFESIVASKLIQIIINVAEPKINQNIEIIEDNLNYLLNNSNCNSQTLSEVFFIDYLKLCLRFGFLGQIANTMLELSSYVTQSFVSWFIPSTDYNYASEHMSRNDLKWCLKLSKTNPNVFTILINSGLNKIHSSHITYNPMPLKHDQTLFIKDEQDSTFLSRSNFVSFIKEVLNLDIPEDRMPIVAKKHVIYVPISNILNDSKEKSTNELELRHEFTDNLSKFDDLDFQDKFDLSNDFLSGSMSPHEVFSIY